MKICTPFITLRNGRRLFAHEKGLKAFCFEVTPEQHKDYLEKKEKRRKKEEKAKDNKEE